MANEAFLNTEEAIEAWDVRPGDKIADFGCGAGFFSVPLGKRVGPNGKVYALDIRPEALEATRAKVKLFHLFNIEPQRADLEAPRGSGIKDESIDKILISNIFFQVENKNAVVEEAYRILKEGGSIMAVEWKEDSVGGPALGERVGKDEVKKIMQNAGLSFFKEFNAGSNHYGMIFSKVK